MQNEPARYHLRVALNGTTKEHTFKTWMRRSHFIRQLPQGARFCAWEIKRNHARKEHLRHA